MGFEANFFQDTLGAYHLTKLNSKILGENSSGINGNFLEILPVQSGKPENCQLLISLVSSLFLLYVQESRYLLKSWRL